MFIKNVTGLPKSEPMMKRKIFENL